MKKYPIGLQGLLEEESIQVTTPIPKSLMNLIVRFQIAHQIVEGGHKLKKEEIMLILCCDGEKAFKRRIENYHKRFTAEQEMKSKLQLIQKEN
jgi:hypothetical protein